MFEYMLAVDTAKLEMERLEKKIARRYRAGPVRNEGEKQPLAALAAVGSHVLQSLGSALISAGERLNNERTSGRTAEA
jgi:hypothetical protein